MSRNSASKIAKSPFRYLFMLIPFVIATVLGLCTMGVNDTAICLWWAVFLLLIGFVTLPLATKIWGNFSSGGFLLSQPLALVLICLLLWTLTHFKICRINIICIVICAMVIAACCYIPKSLRESLVKKTGSSGFVESIVIEETVFLVIFFLMCYFKGFLPDINGQEKFMDYGFMMSMQRNSGLPANDMWLSG